MISTLYSPFRKVLFNILFNPLETHPLLKPPLLSMFIQLIIIILLEPHYAPGATLGTGGTD